MSSPRILPTGAAFTPEFKGKLEELLGERRPAGTAGNPPASAVRWRDVEALRKSIIDAGGAGGGGGTGPGTDPPPDPNPDPVPSDIQAILDRHQQEIDAAELDARNALAAAQNAQAGLNAVREAAEEAVADARADFAIDFQTVVDNADRADTAKLVALYAATNALPARLAPDGAFFTAEVGGAPDEIAPGFPAGYGGVFGSQGVTFPASISANQILRTRGVLPFVAGHTYRLTARVASIGGITAGRLVAQANILGSDHASRQQVSIGNLTPAAAGQWAELMLEWKAPAVAGAAWVRLGATVIAAAAPAREIRIEWLKVEDVSSEKAAAGYSIDAGAWADSASGSAAAALQQKGLAEAAAGLAEDYRDQALVASGDAEAASVAAQSYMQISARYLGGSTIISDTLLDTANGWTRTSTAQGALAVIDNRFAPVGKTWDFTVTATQDDGMFLTSDSDVNWPGQTDASGYVVEIDYTMLSGTVTGAGVSIIWRNTAGTEVRASVALSSMQAGVGSTGRKRIARAVFPKPTGLTGTFSRNTLQFWANNGTLWTSRAAKRIQVHRIIIRAATEEEMGRGEVLSAISAFISESYITKADSTKALADYRQEVTAEFGLTNGRVDTVSTVLSGLNGSVATASLLTQVDGGTAIAGFEIAAWNTAGEGTGAAVKLHGDLLAPGTIAAGAFVAGFGSNMLQNSRFYDGTTHWAASVGAQTTLAVREKGQSWAHPSYRTLRLYQSGTAAEYATLRYAPQTDADNITFRAPGAACQPRSVYCASAYLSLHRCRGRVGLVFFDAAGGVVDSAWGEWNDPVSGSSNSPDTWPRRWVNETAPANAAYVALWVQKEGTLAGNTDSFMFVWKPQLEQTHSLNARPALYTSGEAGYWTGDSFFSRSIRGREIDAEDLVVTKLAILNNAYIRHVNLNGFAVAKILKKVFHTRPNGEDMWRLTQNFPASDWNSGWTTVGTIPIIRVAGYQTELQVQMDHAAAGSWNSGKPNMSVAQLKWQRRPSNQGTWTDLPGSLVHMQSGEWGVRVTNTFGYTDQNTVPYAAGVSTLYRLVARKANILRHQNMSPYLDNFSVTLTHYKQGA